MENTYVTYLKVDDLQNEFVIAVLPKVGQNVLFGLAHADQLLDAQIRNVLLGLFQGVHVEAAEINDQEGLVAAVESTVGYDELRCLQIDLKLNG